MSSQSTLDIEIGPKYIDFEKLRNHFTYLKSSKIYKIYIEYPTKFMNNFMLGFRSWREKINQMLPFRIQTQKVDDKCVFIEFDDMRKLINFLFKYQSSFYYKLCKITIVTFSS